MPRAYDILKTPQDLTHLSWDEHAAPSGMAGTRAKAREGTGPNAVFYKMQHTGDLGRNACDCFAELICARLMRQLGVEHAPTQLLFAQYAEGRPARWVIRSRSFRQTSERAIPLPVFFEMRGKPHETPLDLCLRMGWEHQLAQIFLVDYLTATRSRDESCFEVLCSKDGAYRLSPCMPRGFSLANAFPGQTWRLFATADVNTANYLGNASLEKNLDLIPQDFPIPRFDAGLRETLFAGLADVEPAPLFLEASWSIISGRWQHLESLRNL